ncbi:hypothetical protein D3C72_1333970 [compost metagenome]
MSAICCSSTRKKSADNRMKSASWPAFSVPFTASSPENQALPCVHRRKACSRSSRFSSPYRARPPTVRPVTSHDSATQGL